MNYYLKASDEATMTQALLDAGVLYLHHEEGGESIEAVSPGFSLDVIGEIVRGEVAIEGWHANLLGELSDDQVTQLTEIILPEPPANPYRVWA